LTAEDRRAVADWIAKNGHDAPEPVRIFLALHQAYLTADGDPRKPFDSMLRELRRALGITPSSERRPSGSPRAGLPLEDSAPLKHETERDRLLRRIARSELLRDWHRGLDGRHLARVTRLKEKLANMMTKPEHQRDITDDPLVEEAEPTEEEKAAAKASTAQFIAHLLAGDGTDPTLQPANETLMPGGAVCAAVETVDLPVAVPPDLAGARIIKEMTEQRVRYDFAVTVTRVEMDVEKKVLVDEVGERHVLTASTRDVGPPRFSVTWSALATLAVLVGQFALPLNRLGTMLSTSAKRFTAGSLSRLLHYVAERFAPIYLQLAKEIANARVLAGDDTSCRVIEVSRHQAKAANDAEYQEPPPWAAYRTPAAAEEAFRRCEEARKERQRRRDNGDREASPSPEETPSLGVQIGRRLPFESPRRNRDGVKQAMHTTVVSGRAVADDPRSLIVFYRSHLGSHGNLLEALLQTRHRDAKDLVIQGDLSTTNLVVAPELRSRLSIRLIGCWAHARRPFANYEHEDPVYCGYILHLFKGLAMHEDRLNVHGRNRENVLAVRQNESRALWATLLELATDMAVTWSPATKLGAGARYIINHFEKLTAYLDDPDLEPTNNLRERMLRTEKLIEGSSMFRRSLEGRFVLDIVRTVLQTAVAAGVPVHEYVTSLLQANEDDVAKHPERFTPRAWAATKAQQYAASVAS